MTAVEKQPKIDEAFIREGAGKVTDKEIRTVARMADEILGKIRGSTPLARYAADSRALLAMVKDYLAGAYKKVPYWVIGKVVFVFLYVLNPLDLVPDVLPFVGQLDDAAMLGLCLVLVEKELNRYAKWTGEKDE